jgi:hypothetical protein
MNSISRQRIRRVLIKVFLTVEDETCRSLKPLLKNPRSFLC